MARVYESRTNRALVHNYFIARKYCVLSRYVANNYINVFPANTFFNDAYQTISDIQFIATGRVAPVTGYKYHAKSRLNTPVWGSLRSPNYSPLLPHPLPQSGSIVHWSLRATPPPPSPIYQAAPLETNTSLLQRFTADCSRNSWSNAVP